MAAWRLYRHRNSDGGSKDWAVKTNPDGSITSRWGKTAARLPGVSTRNGIRQFDIERQKQAKGYVFVAEVDIDSEGQVFLSGQAMHEHPESPLPAIGTLYWHIEYRANPATGMALASEIRRLFDVVQALTEYEAIHEQTWSGWQQLLDLSVNAEPFVQSGQIRQAHGVLPWLFLLALKRQAINGVEIGMATESSREVSVDLKAEPDILAFFGTDLDSIRAIAELLGLLKPRLNLALALCDTDDCWF
ncbi:hypothetical protein [Methylobacter sp. S3L5C]|uniref:hypothetical protein n=1 Tax=Methylobacter sp. S3L5C TaxID=2839024 RepID=UPI001FAD72CB|nr:hypothetical protein [Methylobacter sp. S3L5C]UOA07340.1 hypothetical protein KKZ03_13760 [Methylobacter sp. S3L5C]